MKVTGFNRAFLDMIFNILLAFVSMVVILFFIIKTEVSPPNVDNKNELVISLQWNHDTGDDLDIWVQNPNRQIVNFFSREAEGLFLERDDLGRSNDFVTLPDGTKKLVERNEEIVNVRKLIPGRYVINAHLYSADRQRTIPLTARVTVVRVHPFQQFPEATKEFNSSREERTILIFYVSEKGDITVDTDPMYEPMANRR